MNHEPVLVNQTNASIQAPGKVRVEPSMNTTDERAAKPTSARQLWWQKSVIQRSMSSIEPDLENVIQKSPFLQRHEHDDKAKKGIALFAKHELIKGSLLGKGGFSNVYELDEIRLDPEISLRCDETQQTVRESYAKNCSRYCIKNLQEKLVQSPKDFQCAAIDLGVEASFMSAVSHDNVLRIRGLPINGLKSWQDGSHDGYFIVYDKLDITLDRQIEEWKEKPVAIEEKIKYANQLADSLAYLHDNRIVFRDLKPHNIGFLDGKVKLFDFGLCREIPNDEYAVNGVFTMSGVGTRRYMAVEIINSGKYNLKADVYSWSMIFWEMLSLERPYSPYSTMEHRRKVCRKGERPQLDPKWPLWLQNLLKCSWEESVQDRYTMEDACNVLQGTATKKARLNRTNHDKEKRSSVLPDSPTGVRDLLDETVSFVSSSDNDSSSPPPAPKRPTVFLKLPEIAVKTIAFPADKQPEPISSPCLELDDSFTKQLHSEVVHA